MSFLQQLREAVFETLRGAGVDLPCETLRHEPITVQGLAAR